MVTTALCSPAAALPSEARAQHKTAASMTNFSLGQLFTARGISQTKASCTWGEDWPLKIRLSTSVSSNKWSLLSWPLSLLSSASSLPYVLLTPLWILSLKMMPQNSSLMWNALGETGCKPKTGLFPLMSWLFQLENIWLAYFPWIRHETEASLFHLYTESNSVEINWFRTSQSE